jgi:DNA-binding NarL/FixJ family response regulator
MADGLGVSERAVEKHVTGVLSKLETCPGRRRTIDASAVLTFRRST